MKKLRRNILLVLTGIMGIVLLAFTFLNLAPARRYATSQVNQILAAQQLPVHVESIRKILPGAVGIRGISICGPGGDTLIYCGDLDSRIRLRSLLRHKVIVKELDLDAALVALSRSSKEEGIDIAEAFKGAGKGSPSPGEKPPSKWKISIRQGRLTHIQFRMNDSLGGIHICEDASEIILEKFAISLTERALSIGSLFVDGSSGTFQLTPRLNAPKNEQGSPWNLGFQELIMKDLDFRFSRAVDSLLVEASIGQGSIRANAFDLSARKADLKKIDLDQCVLTLRGGTRQTGNREMAKEESKAFRWDLSSESIKLRNSVLDPGAGKVGIFNEIELQVGDFRLHEDHAGVRLRKAALETTHGFSLKRMSGELESRGDGTRLEMDIRTTNSRLAFKSTSDGPYGEILYAPGQIASASLKLEKSRLSLKDLAGFEYGMEDWLLFRLLGFSQLDVEGDLVLKDELLDVRGVSLTQEDKFNIGLSGKLQRVFQFEESTGNMDFHISDPGQAWLDTLASTAGFSGTLPDLKGLSLHGTVSGPLKSPDLLLMVESPLGLIDAEASLDLQKELYTLAYSMRGIHLGELSGRAGLGSFTGSGEFKGRGFSGDKMLASFYLRADTIGFNGYDYRNTQLTGTIEPGDYGFQLVANDPAFKGDLQMELQRSDSASILETSGEIQVRLNDLRLVKDILHIQTALDGRLVVTGDLLETELRCRDMIFVAPEKEARVEELTTRFRSDSTGSSVQADAGFLHAGLQLTEPLNGLDSLGKLYRDYFSSFRNASHIAAVNRVSALPAIDATLALSCHELYDVLAGDSGIHFVSVDASLHKEEGQNSLRCIISGEDFSFKAIEADKFKATINDTAGSLVLGLLADSISLLSGPENRLRLNANLFDRDIMARVTVDNYGDQDLYQLGIAGSLDSSRLVLEIPERKLRLNGTEWRMEDPGLLSIDLRENLVLPSLQIRTDSSYLHFSAKREDPLIAYAMDLNRVDLTSIIRNDIFPGEPDGSFSGAIEYRTDRGGERRLDSEILIGSISFSGQDWGNIRLNGSYSGKASDAYLMDLHAWTDSLEFKLKGERSNRGEHEIEGNFTRFPLVFLEPFSKAYISEVGGSLSGSFRRSYQQDRGHFSGQMLFQDASLRVNMLNSVFRIPDQRIEIAEQKAVFDEFTILDTMNKALKVDGSIEFGERKIPWADLIITSTDLQMMNRDESSRAAFSANVRVDSRISVKGPLDRPEMSGILHLTEGTEIFYLHMEDLRMTETEKIINFVSHSPHEGAMDPPPRLVQPERIGGSSIETVIEIDPGTLINFTLERRMFDIQLNVKGGGNIHYNLANEQMALSGRYEIGEGTSLLKLFGWPNKSFRLTEGGFIRWDGRVEDPELNLEAENKVSTSYVNPIDGSSRNIDFFVILSLTGYLSDLDVGFTIRTPDQYVMSVINTLDPEEQMRQAISVLLFESIDLPGVSSSTDYVTQQVNQILSSQLNQLTRTAIKGVDISFGLDTYDQSARDGSSETTTSLSYEVRKSFLNNRAQIEFSGRLKDAKQEPGSSEHSLNNLSFEYKLDSAANKYLKIYNEHTYDDVFEGEVIKTGIGFSYKKRYSSFKDIWRRKE